MFTKEVCSFSLSLCVWMHTCEGTQAFLFLPSGFSLTPSLFLANVFLPISLGAAGEGGRLDGRSEIG